MSGKSTVVYIEREILLVYLVLAEFTPDVGTCTVNFFRIERLSTWCFGPPDLGSTLAGSGWSQNLKCPTDGFRGQMYLCRADGIGFADGLFLCAAAGAAVQQLKTKIRTLYRGKGDTWAVGWAWPNFLRQVQHRFLVQRCELVPPWPSWYSKALHPHTSGYKFAGSGSKDPLLSSQNKWKEVPLQEGLLWSLERRQYDPLGKWLKHCEAQWSLEIETWYLPALARAWGLEPGPVEANEPCVRSGNTSLSTGERCSKCPGSRSKKRPWVKLLG